VFQEQVKRLRETDQFPPLDLEGGDLGRAVVDQLAGVVVAVARGGSVEAVNRLLVAIVVVAVVCGRSSRRRRR